MYTCTASKPAFSVSLFSHSNSTHINIPCYLILPLKLRPHLPELGISAHCRLDVVHDVNVDVVQHDTVAVRSQTNNVVHCVCVEGGGERRGEGREGEEVRGGRVEAGVTLCW